MSKRVGIVGGGVAGLIAAIDLARGGAQTILFERAEALGGRARTRFVDGFAFNQGAHALYRRGAFLRTLTAFGIDAPGGGPDFSTAAMLWGQTHGPLPLSVATILRASPLTVVERLRLLSLFGKLARIDVEAWRGRPLADFTAPFSPRLRAVVEALVRISTYAHSPQTLDAGAALGQLRLSAGGVIYVDGGWETLVGGLERVARQAGVQIRASAPVSRLTREGEGWRLSEDVLADAVVLATPPDVAVALALMSTALRDAARATAPIRATCLDYALRRLPAPRATFALGAQAPVYFSVHSASARLAPPDGALVHAARYLAQGEAGDAAQIDTLAALVARLQPGFAAEVVHTARLVGMPVTYDHPQAARRGRMAPVALNDAPGLFLAGDWVGEGAMLSDAAAKSAREAATSALTYVSANAGHAAAA